MWTEIAQGGAGLLGLGVGFKLLWPLLSKMVEASTSRSETDTTIHRLYKETVEANHEMSIKLAEALERIAILQVQVDALSRELSEARAMLSKATSTNGGI